MKIALVAGDDLTRNPRFRWEARALVAAGHRVTVYGVQSRGTEEEEDEAGVVYVRVPLKGWHADGGGLRAPVRFARWFDRFRPVVDVAVARETPQAIHAHDLDVAGPAQDAAIALKVPFVLDVAGAAYVDRLASIVAPDAHGAKRRALKPAVDLLRRRGTSLEKKLRRRGVAATVVDTPSLAEDLRRRYGGRRAVVVRTCPPFSAPKRTDALRKKLGAFPTDRLLLLLGPLTEGSGADAAIRALKLLGDGHLLAIVGRASRAVELERLAKAEGVAAQVRFIAPAPDADGVRLVASADVALVPTEPATPLDRIGVPPRLYLCLAAGLPIVASDTPEVGRIVRRTRAGVLYPASSPQDPAALAEAIHTLTSDGTLAKTCAEAAAAAARDEFNWEKESLGLIDVYDAIEGSS